ncbi:unnamed protein product [Brassica oleracea]
MEEPKPRENHIGGTWRQLIQAAFEATKASFPGGEIVAHLDHKSFKGWQKKAILCFNLIKECGQKDLSFDYV